jgi:hypothetical protein
MTKFIYFLIPLFFLSFITLSQSIDTAFNIRTLNDLSRINNLIINSKKNLELNKIDSITYYSIIKISKEKSNEIVENINSNVKKYNFLQSSFNEHRLLLNKIFNDTLNRIIIPSDTSVLVTFIPKLLIKKTYFTDIKNYKVLEGKFMFSKLEKDSLIKIIYSNIYYDKLIDKEYYKIIITIDVTSNLFKNKEVSNNYLIENYANAYSKNFEKYFYKLLGFSEIENSEFEFIIERNTTDKYKRNSSKLYYEIYQYSILNK